MRLPSALLIIVLVACGGDEGDDRSVGDTAGDELCADVMDAEIERDEDGTFTVSATVASSDTGPEKYADVWEVRAEDGTVLGERQLLHPHVDEQPFTRSLSGVEISADVGRVTVAARDSVEGFCGETFEVEVP